MSDKRFKILFSLGVILICVGAYFLLGPYYGGQFIGSLVGVFLFHSLFHYLAKKWLHDPKAMLVASALALPAIVALYAWGSADGEGPNYVQALLNYSPALIIVTVGKFWFFKRGIIIAPKAP